MVEGVGQWIRELALIILVGTLLEMLLPQNHMRRYARVIVGLLVVLAMLTPVMNLFRQGPPVVGTWQGWVPREGETERILEQGARWQKDRESRALEEYRRRLAQRAETLAEGVPGVRKARARVVVSDGTGGEGLGAITRLEMEASLGVVKPVAPVGKGKEGEGAPSQQVAGQLRTMLAQYFGLEPSLVKVRIVGEVE